MVAMFSLFCGATEPIFSSCLPPHNGGYDYLLFDVKEDGDCSSTVAPASTTTVTSVIANSASKFASGKSSAVASSAKVMPEALQTQLPRSKAMDINWHRKWSTASPSFQPFHAKAASEPPPDCFNITANCVAKKHFSSFRVNNSVAKRPKYHFSSIAEKERKIRRKLTTNETIGRISRFMHFLESLNPLNGFKDKDDLENYLYNQSHKIEPKNGEIPNSKPKHPPEALKSPGVKQQKTPISGGGSGGTFHRFPTAKSSGKSSASSPHSPGHAPSGGGGALLSPSHINVPTRSPASAGSASGSSASMAVAEDPNFAIVDISPGQFPRWLGDTCGRINAAFISEYAPTTAAAASFHQHRQIPSGGSPTSPSTAMLQQQQQQRRRPPAPLSAGESHFTFPPAHQPHHQHMSHQSQQHQQRLQHMEMFRKPPAPAPHHQMSAAMLSLPLEEHQQQRVAQPPPPSLPQLVPSLSAALPAFPLAKPPLARKKLPAADPSECSSPSSTGRTTEEQSHTLESPETPPQLPPRNHPPLARQQQMPYQQSPLANFMMGAGGCCNLLPEAMAPPRPPKKGICRSPTTDQQTTPQLRQRQPSHQSLSPSVVESPSPQPIADALAPPIPPKPTKSATPK